MPNNISLESDLQTSVCQLIQAAQYLSEVERALPALAERPVLFTWGARDFAFREPFHERFKQVFANHHTVMLDAGHFWQEDAAEEASTAILEWMAGKK